MSTKYKRGEDVPTDVLCKRLLELSDVFSQHRDKIAEETTMRVPAELDRDADLVLSGAARRMSNIDGVMRMTHLHSRKHTPGYCIVRQSDIDAIGNIIDPPVIVKEGTE